MPGFAVLTASDLGSEGKRVDLGGDAVVDALTEAGFQLVSRVVVPDEQRVIEAQLRAWCDSGDVDLVCTTGGTGLGPRDVTPQATATVIEYEVPGIAEAIRLRTLDITPFAMISRGLAGVRSGCLIVNLPGNPRGARECLEVIVPVLPHAVEVLRGGRGPHPVDHQSRRA